MAENFRFFENFEFEKKKNPFGVSLFGFRRTEEIEFFFEKRNVLFH